MFSPQLAVKKALKVLRGVAGQKTSFLQQVKEIYIVSFLKIIYQKRSRTKFIKNSAKFMKKFGVYLQQNEETQELEVVLNISENATAENIDEIWELVERARLIIKQIKDHGFKITKA